MVQGNGKALKQEFEKCEGFLAKARIKFPNNRDPNYLKTINMIIQASEANETYELVLKISQECKLIYDVLIKKFPKDYGLTYLRGNLNLYL